MNLTMPTVSKILKDTSSIRSKEDKIKFLRSHKQNKALVTILQLAFDPNITFYLPKGEPPYKPSEVDTENTMLYREMRRMYIFIMKDMKISNAKREQLFVEILETVDPEDAKLLIAVKDKTIPYKGITKKLIEETFPTLISKEVNDEQNT